jgi:hypothetical protein
MGRMKDIHACAVCGYPLDAVENLETHEMTWFHIAGQDHVAVPVPAGEIDFHQHCDFCHAEDAPWIVLTKEFANPEIVGGMSSANWSACDECVELVRRKRWGGLVTRGKQAAGERGLPTSRRLLVELYALVERNQLGGIVDLKVWKDVVLS